MIKNQSIKGYINKRKYQSRFFVGNPLQYLLIKYLSFYAFQTQNKCYGVVYSLFPLHYTNKYALKKNDYRLCSNQFQLCLSYFSNEYRRFQFYAVNSDITKNQVLHFTFLFSLQIKIFYNGIYNIFDVIDESSLFDIKFFFRLSP